MEQKLYMAVDLGTSFIKTGVYALDGTTLGGWSEPVNAERPAPDQFIQRGENLYQSVLDCLKNTVKELGDRAKDVRAMAFTGQMAGSMGVDENWNDITSWSCSLDSRYLPYANRQREKLSREFFEIGGTNAPVMCSKYEWFKEDFPAEHKKIRKYVMLNGYIIGKLSGVPVDEAIQQVGRVVEGIHALPAAMTLAKKYNVEMPIVEAAYQVVKEGVAPKDVVQQLMTRGKKPELPPSALDNHYQ